MGSDIEFSDYPCQQSAAQVCLREELFCSTRACCTGSSSAPPQHRGPGLDGHYVLPPERLTSHLSTSELSEVGHGQPVHRLLRQPSPLVAHPSVFKEDTPKTRPRRRAWQSLRRWAWLQGCWSPSRTRNEPCVSNTSYKLQNFAISSAPIRMPRLGRVALLFEARTATFISIPKTTWDFGIQEKGWSVRTLCPRCRV